MKVKIPEVKQLAINNLRELTSEFEKSIPEITEDIDILDLSFFSKNIVIIPKILDTTTRGKLQYITSIFELTIRKLELLRSRSNRPDDVGGDVSEELIDNVEGSVTDLGAIIQKIQDLLFSSSCSS